MRKTKYLIFGVGVLIACVFSLILSRPAQAADESLTLETYYPAPYGVYAELTTTSNTHLATEGGNVGIGTESPAAMLEVAGGVKMGQDTAICDSVKEGTMHYNTTANRMEYCNGSSWQEMGIASTGLYGYCQTQESVSGAGASTLVCGTALAPAMCNPSLYAVGCECPAGYSLVSVSMNAPYSFASGTYSCYKN